MVIANWTVTEVFREKKYNYYNDRPSMGSPLAHANDLLIKREIIFLRCMWIGTAEKPWVMLRVLVTTYIRN